MRTMGKEGVKYPWSERRKEQNRSESCWRQGIIIGVDANSLKLGSAIKVMWSDKQMAQKIKVFVEKRVQGTRGWRKS